jgi:pimeloyl-ACP methyl ester carboxylesterase
VIESVPATVQLSPPVRRSATVRDWVATRAGRAVDAATIRVGLAFGCRAAVRRKQLAARAAYYDAVAATYREIGERLYAPPPPIGSRVERTHGALPGDGTLLDLMWPSAYRPTLARGRAELARWPRCATAHARLFLHREPAPTVICIHGWRAGNPRVAEQSWRAHRLYAAGLDVALFILPHHGPRGPIAPRRIAPFPSQGNLVRTNEGFGQAIADLRQLRRFLEARGAGVVGVAGMSLGAYVSALWATLDAELAFAALLIPLADLTTATIDAEARRGVRLPDEVAAAASRAMAVHRPLARAPRLPGARMTVVMAEGDVITGPRHARALAAHFGAELAAAPGGHLVRAWRDRAFELMLARIERGLGVEPRLA